MLRPLFAHCASRTVPSSAAAAFLFLLLLCCCTVSSPVAAFSASAPNSVCTGVNTHAPRHGGLLAAYTAGTAPFSLRVVGNVSSYEAASANVSLELAATDDAFFKGFMLSAFAVMDNGTVTTMRVGSFAAGPDTPPNDVHLMCGNQALIQSNARDRSVLNLLWIPPTTPGYGRVVFQATVVRSLMVYWKLNATAPLAEVLPAAPVSPDSLELRAATMNETSGTTTIKVQVATTVSPAQQHTASFLVELALGSLTAAAAATDSNTTTTTKLNFTAAASINVRGSTALKFDLLVPGLSESTVYTLRVRTVSQFGTISVESGAPSFVFKTSDLSAPLPPTPQLNASATSPLTVKAGGLLELNLASFVPAASSPLAQGFIGFEVQVRLAASALTSSTAAAAASSSSSSTGSATVPVASSSSGAASPSVSGSTSSSTGGSNIASSTESRSSTGSAASSSSGSNSVSSSGAAVANNSSSSTGGGVVPLAFRAGGRTLLAVSSEPSSAPFSDDGASSFVSASSPSAAVHSLQTVLGSTYEVRVRSLNARGASGWSLPRSMAVTSLCLNSCSGGRGQCLAPDSVCRCPWGWLGADCSLPSSVDGGAKCFGSDDSFCMDFSFNPSLGVADADFNVVTFKLTVKSLGYAGLLFDAPDGMSGGTGYMMTRSLSSRTSNADTIYSPGLYDPELTTPDTSVAESVETWVDSEANPTTIEYTFRKSVVVAPALSVAGEEQDLAWAFGQDVADDHLGNAGKLKIDVLNGRLFKVGRVAYEKIYAGMIAAFLAVVLLGAWFAHMDSSRFGSVGHRMYQWRLGTWKANNGTKLHRVFLDLWPTLVDMLWGEALILIAYAAGFIAMTVVGYDKFKDKGVDGSLVWGHLAVVHYAIVLLPVNKNSVCAWVFQSSFERLIKFHRWLGRMAIVCNWVHFIQMMGARGGKIAYDKDINLWGLIATLAFTVSMLIAWEPIRRRVWRLFIAVHLSLTPIGFIFGCMHTKYMWWLCIPALSLWGIDLAIRYARPFFALDSHTVVAHVIVEDEQPEDDGTLATKAPLKPTKFARFITQLTLDVVGFEPVGNLEPGSYCYLNIPAISALEFHPMSISNFPAPPAPGQPTRLTFHVLDAGSNFTHALREHVSAQEGLALKSGKNLSTMASELRVRLDGPYGRPQVDLFRYRTLVLIGGGIGITPLLSIVDYLSQQMSSANTQYAGLNAVHLVWSTRLAASFDWAKPLLARTQKLHASRIKLHLFVFAGPDPTPKVRRKLLQQVQGVPGQGVQMGVIVDHPSSPRSASSRANNNLGSRIVAPGIVAAHTIVGAGFHEPHRVQAQSLRQLQLQETLEPPQHMVQFHYDSVEDVPEDHIHVAPGSTTHRDAAAAGAAAGLHSARGGGGSSRGFGHGFGSAGPHTIYHHEENGEQEEWTPAIVEGLADYAQLMTALELECSTLKLNTLPAWHAAAISGHAVHSVAVLACGPGGLVADAQKQAHTHDFHFHKESFTF